MNILKQRLQEKNISIYKMAKDLNVSYSTLNDIVNQKTDIGNVNFELALEIASYISISPYDFMIRNRNLEVIYKDFLNNKYIGTVTEEQSYFYINFIDYKKETQKIQIGKVKDDITPFVGDYAAWIIEDVITNQLLENWEEFL